MVRGVDVDVDVDVDRQECAKRQFLSSVLFCCAVLVGRVSCFAPCVEKKREEARKKSLWTRTYSVAAFKSPATLSPLCIVSQASAVSSQHQPPSLS